MPDDVRGDRRRFVLTAALGLVGARSGAAGALGEAGKELRSLARADAWINSPPLTPDALRGKVVLIDFWTYTCINWLRTLPYVRAWAAKYRDRGLTVIGVHAPEFAFERNLDNVRRAVEQMRIAYPVAADGDHVIWRAFRNQYWPALYFVDGTGRVRDRQFGEGEYERAERVIQRLLGDAGAATAADSGLVSVTGEGVEAAADWASLQSPEQYLGHARATSFASPGGVVADVRRAYVVPGRLASNQWAVAGEWTFGSQAAASERPDGRIVCRFQARDLHLVMGPARPGAPVRFRVSIDGQPPGAAHGVDVDAAGNGTVSEQRLYQLIRQAPPVTERQFEIRFLDAGVEAFAFTFG